ncbi:MAG: NosD domain-containing protein [archaeon]
MKISKRLFLSSIFLVFLTIVNFVPLIALATAWSQNYGGPETDEATSLVVAADGGYAIAGYTKSFGAGDDDFWLIKTDATGNLQWNKTYGGEHSDRAHSLVQTSDGGYAIGGTLGSDFGLIKTDSGGNVEWNQSYGEIFEYAYCLIQTSDDGYALVGFKGKYASFENTDCWLVKTDKFGNMDWNQTFGSTRVDIGHTLIQTSDGGYVIAGESAHGCWLIKTDTNGNLEWNQTYYELGNGAFNSVLEHSDGGYVLSGTTDKAFLIRMDKKGNIVWNQTYGGQGGWPESNSLIETLDGGYALAGRVGLNFWLIKTDSKGNMEWEQTIGGRVVDTATALVQASDGGFVLAGVTKSYGLSTDFWLVKTYDQDHVLQHHVYIRPDGTVEGTDKIQRNGNAYIFTEDIVVNYIFVEKDNIIVNGNGYTVSGSGIDGGGIGFVLINRENVSIRNTKIQNFTTGISLEGSLWNTIIGNNISDNKIGIFSGFDHNFIFENNITDNRVGIHFITHSYDNTVYSNNFVNNSQQIEITQQTTSENGIPNAFNKGMLGNYWSDYNGTDGDGDGIGDTPYVINKYNQDNYPLVKSYVIPEFPSFFPLLLAVISLMTTAIIFRYKLHNKQNKARNKKT